MDVLTESPILLSLGGCFHGSIKANFDAASGTYNDYDTSSLSYAF